MNSSETLGRTHSEAPARAVNYKKGNELWLLTPEGTNIQICSPKTNEVITNISIDQLNRTISYSISRGERAERHSKSF